MFVVDDAVAAAIRSAYTEIGVAAAIQELRRHIPGFDDDEEARRWVRTIAGWRALPDAATVKPPLRPRKRRPA